MAKKLFWAQGLIVLAALLIALIFSPSVGYAYRGTWANYYGSIKLDGQNVPPGGIVTARIKGSNAGPWTTPVFTYLGNTRYSIDVPMNSGQGEKDGGVNGDVVFFTLTVNGQVYLDPTTDVWQDAIDKNHPISVFTPFISIPASTLPDATVGLFYSAGLGKVTGGTMPYQWQAANLPAGLSISADPSDPAKGIISGTPAASPLITAKETKFAVIVTVIDSNGFTAQKTFTLTLIWQKGDANGDGGVDMGDVIEVIRIYFGWDVPTPGADANGDLYINMLDVTYIMNFLLGL